MLRIKRCQYELILEHARETYPNECCGVLLGNGAIDKEVGEATRLTNVNIDRASDRYEIDPLELHKIEKEARDEEGLDVVGFYHSHPDHPDEPSEFDRSRGWPIYSYLIVAVDKDGNTKARSWSFDGPDDPFSEEKIVIIDGD